MDLDELQSVRDRERQTDKLQQLRESFYEDAGALINQLRKQRERAAERADDPFDAPEVSRLSDEIDTAEQTVEAIYEKRVGKIVKAASFAAADLPAESDGMTAEEQELFEMLVADIKENRRRVMDVLAGETDDQDESDQAGQPADPANVDSPVPDAVDAETPPESESPASQPAGGQTPPEPAETGQTPPEPGEGPPKPPESAHEHVDGSPTEDVSAADVMGPPDTESTDSNTGGTSDGGQSPSADASGPHPDAPSTTTTDDERTAPSQGENAGDESDSRQEPSSDGGTARDRGSDAPRVERETVRITADVGDIFGVDKREYDLAENDVVTLPAANADPLIERDAAERLE